MDVIHYPDDPRPVTWRSPVLALGNFDGLHRGHVKIVERIQRGALERGGTSVVLTFVVEGIAVGLMGVAAGWLLGWAGSALIETVPAPGAANEDGTVVTLKVAKSLSTYGLAAGIALASAVVAAWIPARKAARTDPLAIIRGAT